METIPVTRCSVTHLRWEAALRTLDRKPLQSLAAQRLSYPGCWGVELLLSLRLTASRGFPTIHQHAAHTRLWAHSGWPPLNASHLWGQIRGNGERRRISEVCFFNRMDVTTDKHTNMQTHAGEESGCWNAAVTAGRMDAAAHTHAAACTNEAAHVHVLQLCRCMDVHTHSDMHLQLLDIF